MRSDIELVDWDDTPEAETTHSTGREWKEGCRTRCPSIPRASLFVFAGLLVGAISAVITVTVMTTQSGTEYLTIYYNNI
jgi:hypothetical protein